MFLQICLAFLLRELAEIDKQLDQKTQEKCCLCGLFVGLLKRGDEFFEIDSSSLLEFFFYKRRESPQKMRLRKTACLLPWVYPLKCALLLRIPDEDVQPGPIPSPIAVA